MIKSPALYALTLLLLCGSVAATENNTAIGNADAVLFAGKGDEFYRYLRLGLLALENDDAAAAADYLRQALNGLQDQELRAQASDLLLETLLVCNQKSEAEEVLKNAEKEFAGNPVKDLMQARWLLADGKTSECIDLCRKLTVQLKSCYLCFRALELQGRAFTAAGDSRAAQKSYADLAVVAANDALWKFKALEALIFVSLENKDEASARLAYSTMMKELPEDIRSQFSQRLEKLSWLIACSQKKVGNIKELFWQAAEKSRIPDPLLARVGFALADALPDAVEAVKISRRAWELSENNIKEKALRRIIDHEIKNHLWADALTDGKRYLKLFEKSPGKGLILAAMGEVSMKLDHNDEAVKYWETLFNDAEVPEKLRFDAAVALAKLYQKAAKTEKALKMYSFATEHAPNENEHFKLYQETGEYLYQLGRYSDAAESFRSAAVESNPAAEKAQLWLVQSCYRLKNYNKAHEYLQNLLSSADLQIKRKAAYLDALLGEKMLTPEKASEKFSAFAETYPQAPEAQESLFQAGVLASVADSAAAGKLFMKYAEKYPGEKAANALYKALNSALLRGEVENAGKILALLDKDYPESKFTIGAHFSMVDFLRRSKNSEEALKLLDKVEKRYAAQHTDLIPEILYDRAILNKELRDVLNMQKALETLVQQHGKHPLAARAFFLLGDLHIYKKDFEAALTAFQQARVRSAGAFSYGCAGKAADAAYSLYTQNRQEQYLHQAREGYENLLKIRELTPEFRIQSIYKLGRCLEDASNKAGALRQYRHILYSSQLSKREGRDFYAVWCAKALEGALKLLLPEIRQSTNAAEAAALQAEAERLLRIAGELELAGEDITKQLEAVRDAAGQK